ncbi:MAG: endonuclease MutS2 [Clostridia bacterium]|nr:endonuclease MutS2 [Clostridia bacterium]
MNDPIKTLELDEILKRVSAYACSPCGRSRIINSLPTDDFSEVQSRLEFTSQAVLLITKYRHGGIESFDDINDTLEKVRAGATLSMGELLKVATVLRSSRLAKSSLDGYSNDVDKIKDVAFRIFADERLEMEIKRDIISDTEMADTASDTLKDIRYRLRKMKSKLIERLSSFTRSNVYSKYLQDNFYTMRGGRYVLPVKSECRQSVPGLLHDQSASGSTVYIEPFDVVTMNNDIVRLEGDEAREIERILQVFTAKVLAQIDNLYDALERLTLLDAYFAKANYSITIDGILPELNMAKEIRLLGARHPLIDSKRVVPIDISVGENGKNILLISGPNTGGKTVSLKTIGLFSYMLSVGLLVPCRTGSVMAIFDKIFCDVGDDQNISMNLSTFSSHVKNLKEITESFTNESLILLDEIGSCTAPDEGAAIAVGVMDYIAETNAKAVITTHYPQLKEYAVTSNKILNAGMQFDKSTLKPTYKILMGYPGSSNAIETAASLGLADKILKTAQSRLHNRAEEDYDTLLKKAFEMKSDAEEELKKATEIRETAESKLEKIANDEKKIAETLYRINENAKAETKRLVKKATDKAEEIIEEIKQELKEADEKALLKAKKDYKRLAALAYDNGEEIKSVLHEEFKEGEIQIGAKVVIKSFGLEGTVKKIRPEKKEAEINCDGKFVKVKLSDLAKPYQKQTKPRPQTKTSIISPLNQSKQEFLDKEIMVIGMNVIDAWEEIEQLLDNASRIGLKNLRIVHGKGTGALGKGIQSYLRSHPAVKSFRYGRYGEGDNGVTLVELV